MASNWALKAGIRQAAAYLDFLAAKISSEGTAAAA
jgi:hypothetical protein